MKDVFIFKSLTSHTFKSQFKLFQSVLKITVMAVVIVTMMVYYSPMDKLISFVVLKISFFLWVSFKG